MRPIVIGDTKIDLPVALGPMAGVTDRPFRLLCEENGCGLVFTEMVSAKAIYYHNRNTDDLLKTGDHEHVIGVQLFGEDPDILAEMALQIEDRFDLIDLNMGCPVLKVIRNGEGSALLKEPKKVEAILSKLCRTVHKPVSVKIRKGFAFGDEQAPEIARIAESCGVSLITIHGRVREQFFEGEVDLASIRHVKEAVSIPVIGNGDVKDGPSALRMMEETGCDGIMVAQAAMGNPWIFREINAYIEHGAATERPSNAEIIDMLLRHAAMEVGENGERMGILKMRSHASWYLKGFPHANALRDQVNRLTTLSEMRELLLPLKE